MGRGWDANSPAKELMASQPDARWSLQYEYIQKPAKAVVPDAAVIPLEAIKGTAMASIARRAFQRFCCQSPAQSSGAHDL